MQTVNFPCTHCKNLMAVGIDLLGRHVRCPTCKQVVQAPATAPQSAPAPAENPFPAPQPGPTVPNPFAPLPPSPAPSPNLFAPPPPSPAVPPNPLDTPDFKESSIPEEGHESIFGEALDEDVFGSRKPPKPEMPDPVAPAVSNPFAPLQPAAAAAPPSPFARSEPTAAAAPANPFAAPEPPPPATSAPAASPESPWGGGNPFAPPPSPFASGSNPFAASPPAAPEPAASPFAASAPTLSLSQVPGGEAWPAAAAAAPAPAPSPFAPPPGWPGQAANGSASPPTETLATAPPSPFAAPPSPFAAPPSPFAAPQASQWESAPAPSAPAAMVPARESPPAQREMVARQPSGGNGIAWLMLSILVPYAITMTGLVIWLAVFNKPPHPLDTIPDLPMLRENPPAKKTGNTVAIKLHDPETPLPPHLLTSLGQTLRIGDLEVTPEKIESRPVSWFEKQKGQTDPVKRTSKREALVMHLRVKNVSQDVEFCPNDPAFARSYKSGSKPYMFLTVGNRKFFGGMLDWPTASSVEREYIEGQEKDNIPLKPGEERTTVVCSSPLDGSVEAVRNYKKQEELVWRIQLRRGLIRYAGDDVPVTTVVGVEFFAKEVKQAGRKS